ncbi:MAG: hypothetical protein GYB31_07640 [Bacteroidetes bacterium]|nr:hypothetical protein [Bacteroidota bacterium]
MKTIRDVLKALDEIIDHAKARESKLALFAWVYRRTTAQIGEAIKENRFSDNAFMERFDVAFAERYIDAYWQHHQGKQPTASWLLSFQESQKPLSLLQHTLLGMNAHINLDLGIVAAELAPGDKIYDIKSDFMLVNDILQQLIDDMQNKLSRISGMMRLVDWLGGKTDEAYIDFNIRKARQHAWEAAVILAHKEPEKWDESIQALDHFTYQMGCRICKPAGRMIRYSLKLVCLFETKSVQQAIRLLN